MHKKEIASKWNDMSEKGKASVIEKLWLKAHTKFRRRPVPFKRFISESHYLDQEKHVYPNITDLGVRLMGTKKNILIVEAGLGAGKSFLASLLIVYVTHLLLCLKDAHDYFGLSRDKPISIITMNINETKARKIVFGSASRFISRSPWFRQFECNILKKSILLDDTIELLCGNSAESAAIGLNLFMGVLDEANFFIDNEDKSGAEEIFDVITTRVSSRFGSRGLTIVISSSNHDEDFTTKKKEEALANPDEMMFFTARTWNMKRRESMAKDVFVFDTETFQVIEPPQYGEHKLVVGEKQMRELFFHDDRDDQYWIIPLDYKSSFKRNPEKFARDLGCRSLKHSDKFIKMQGFIDASFSHDNPNWYKGDGLWDLPPEADRTEEPLYIHIDLGLNKETNNRMGDACGFAVGHFDDYDMEKGGRPRTKIVGLERITQDPQINEVRFSDVRQRVIMLHKAGFEIAKVTIDGWQSIDTIQTLNDLGIPCELLSIDKTVEPYEAYKESMYEGRIKIPHNETAISESKQLIIIKGKKVDHPKGGSKDCTDALAGVTFCIAMDYGVDSSDGKESNGLIRMR